MFKTKRNRKRSKFFLILPFLILVIFSVFIFLKLNQTSIISPVPFGKTFTFNKDNDPRLREIKKLLSKTNIEYNSLEIANNSFLLILKNNEEIIFSSKKDFTSQISSLQLIITRSTIEGKRINRLDFRFDRPVITYR